MILGVSKLAKELEVTRTTIYRYIEKGMPYKIGGNGRRVFELEEVKAWLKGEK